MNTPLTANLLIADPKIIAIPVYENCEPLIDLRTQDIILYGPSPEVENNMDYTKMRVSVYNKLLKAQELLLPYGLKICLYEAYRSLDLQQQLFTTRFDYVTKYIAGNDNKIWSYEEIFLETIKMVSPVINLDGSKNIPPHSTGAAVDVYLVNLNNEIVDMGMHPKDWIDDDNTSATHESEKISDIAKTNRNILYNVMTAPEVGFINYYTEYWHYSYGDRYAAYYHGEQFAIYGNIDVANHICVHQHDDF